MILLDIAPHKMFCCVQHDTFCLLQYILPKILQLMFQYDLYRVFIIQCLFCVMIESSYIKIIKYIEIPDIHSQYRISYATLCCL